MIMYEFSGYHFKEATKSEDYPKDKEFFIGITFHMRSEHMPAYDFHDPLNGTTHQVPSSKVWILKDEIELQKFVEEVTKTRTQFVFFRVEKIGKVEIKVNVNIDP